MLVTLTSCLQPFKQHNRELGARLVSARGLPDDARRPVILAGHRRLVLFTFEDRG